MPPTPTIAITGAEGFLGWHLRSRLHALAPETEVRVIGRAAYDDEALLAEAVKGVDAVVHLAGANRGPDAAIYDTNVSLAKQLVDALTAVGGSPYLVFANTKHADTETAYGISKRVAAATLAGWARRQNARFGDLRLPNLFGEEGRPNYNSAVATFCHDLAGGHRSEVNTEGRTELLHAQDASSLILGAVAGKLMGTRRIEGQQISIPDVYGRLRRLYSSYRGAALPEMRDRLDLRLFNTLRTAMFPGHYPISLASHTDPRGAFVEVARGSGHTQTSVATTAPGYTRGDHFHLDKIERFVVISGNGIIALRKLFSDEVVSFAVDGDRPVVVDMPPLYAHSITNVGSSDLLTLLWANDHFDPASPDTYPEVVERVPVGVLV